MLTMHSVRSPRLAATAALLLATALAPTLAPKLTAQELTIGSPAPKLDVAWLKGDPLDLTKGEHVVVVECWATWCGPCIASIPHVTQLQARLRDKGLRVVGVAVWDERAKVEKFLEQRGEEMGYAVAFDADQNIAKRWLEAAGRDGIPCSFVVGKDQKIAWIGHPMAGLDDVVAEVLAGTYDIEVARLLQQKEAEVQKAFQAEDWARVAKSADEILQRAPDRLEPWAMKLMAAKSAGDDAQQLGIIANAALQALAQKPKQLAMLVQYVLLRGEDDEVAAQAAAALPALERTLEQHGENSDLLLAHVRLLDALGKEKAAVAAAHATLQKLQKAPDTDAQALVALAAQLGASKRAKAYVAPALAALKSAGEALGETTPEILETKFRVLVAAGDDGAAKVTGKELIGALQDKCGELNSFAWGLLTEAPTSGRFADLALIAAQAMSKCEDFEHPAYLDTAALAKFENGMVGEAIELQEKAIAMGVQDPEYQERLDRYKQAKAATAGAKGESEGKAEGNAKEAAGQKPPRPEKDGR